MTINLSDMQARAIAAIRDWYENRRGEQQIFRLFGYAGTGKTTITALAIDALGFEPMTPGGLGGVLFAAFTGKAALVMTRKGTPAQTIHSLIYRVSEATPEEIARVTEDLASLRRDLPRMGPAERDFAMTRIAQLELRLEDIHQPKFLINEQSTLRDADLLVLDEVSMVGADMAHDLLAFGKPILVLGDPGQLPPIKGLGFFTEAAPDVMLTEVHRQAGDSAILRLATLAREGLPIPPGAHDDHVWKMSRHDVGPAQMLQGGQVICGTNATRRSLNTAMKRAAGFGADYPTGSGEKIICLKNRHDLGLINGMFLTLTDVRQDPGDDFLQRDGRDRGRPEHRRTAELLARRICRPCRLRPRARTAGKAGTARSDRDQLGLRHHLPQVPGLAVGKRRRVRRRVRTHRRGPQPLALHRDHAGRERSGDPCLISTTPNRSATSPYVTIWT